MSCSCCHCSSSSSPCCSARQLTCQQLANQAPHEDLGVILPCGLTVGEAKAKIQELEAYFFRRFMNRIISAQSVFRSYLGNEDEQQRAINTLENFVEMLESLKKVERFAVTLVSMMILSIVSVCILGLFL